MVPARAFPSRYRADIHAQHQEDTVAKKDEQPVLVRMPTDLHHALKTAARSEDRTMAQFIREAIRDRLAATSEPSTRRV